jgi:hypothetical protein
MFMTTAEVKDLFLQCDYPFYKQLKVSEHEATCTLYSLNSNIKQEIVLDLTDPAKAVHKLAIEVIKLRTREMQHPEQLYALSPSI